MESIFDYDGKTLTKSDENTFDWTCEFKDDNTFIIVNTPNESLRGKYDSTKATGAILLTLEFDDGSTAQATYGERKYNDGQSVDSLNLTTNDKFVTFLKDAQKPK